MRLSGLLTHTQAPTVDARQVNFTIESKQDIDRLTDIIGRLEALEGRTDRISGER